METPRRSVGPAKSVLTLAIQFQEREDPIMPRLALALLALAVSLTGTSCQSFGVSSASIKPFISDGCSMFPDGTVSEPTAWRAACVEHDLTYWKGGSRVERRQADRVLRHAIRDRGHPVVAWVAYAGVRLGGGPWWPTPWRWGFGWPYGRGYRPLSPAEERQVLAKTPAP